MAISGTSIEWISDISEVQEKNDREAAVVESRALGKE